MDNSKAERKAPDARPNFFQKYRGPILIIISALFFGISKLNSSRSEEIPTVSEPQCPKTRAISPNFDKSVDTILYDPSFREEALKKLVGAVQIPTEIEDEHPEPKDDIEYYARFFELHEYLQETFPLVYKHLKVEKVNEVSLLYTWEGKDQSLKPVMLAAHQDVVPVNPDTYDSWKHPPYSGFHEPDTDLVYGRGSLDCKNSLIGELQAVEQLLKDGFEPTRTVIIALGSDEEAHGSVGAKYLNKVLYNRYGEDGIYAVVDEGAPVLRIKENLYFAAPITAEKGYLDLEVVVHGQGGHSSAPPAHTTIGVAAELISQLEKTPFSANLTPENPFMQALNCVAEHNDDWPDAVRKAILESPYDPKQKERVISFLQRDRMLDALIRTTQAVDIIHGGVKSNALPELTTFVVNHRIDITSSVNETLEHDLSIARSVALQLNYGLSLDGKVIIPETTNGLIEIFEKGGLEPAPHSPTKGSPVWELFAGTIQDTFANHIFNGTEEIDFYVTPGLITGNTDTKHYWKLTKNIYRFWGAILEPSVIGTIHSVNESIKLSSHLSTIAFLYEYIVNTSENL